jgi:hypothetical protein
MTINLKVEKHIYNFFSIFKIFYIFLEIHYQNYQNNPLSTNPFSYLFLVVECRETWAGGLTLSFKQGHAMSTLSFLEVAI